jgi:hypothetical protein
MRIKSEHDDFFTQVFVVVQHASPSAQPCPSPVPAENATSGIHVVPDPVKFPVNR